MPPYFSCTVVPFCKAYTVYNKKKKSKDQFPRSAISETAEPVLLAVATRKSETTVRLKFPRHDHYNRVIIWQKSVASW